MADRFCVTVPATSPAPGTAAKTGPREAWVTVEPGVRPVVQVGERKVELDIRSVEPGVYSVIVDDRVYEIDLDLSGADIKAQVGGIGVQFGLQTERARKVKDVAASISNKSGAKSGQANILAPMPGRVVKILVKAGDAVKAGQGVLVVEAMKMENEMRATRDGVIKQISVNEGQTVDAGQTLAAIE